MYTTQNELRHIKSLGNVGYVVKKRTYRRSLGGVCEGRGDQTLRYKRSKTPQI